MSYCRGISSMIVRAKKNHICNACECIRWNLKDLADINLTFAEKRAVIQAKWDGWRILKGQMYLRQFNEFAGDVYTFKARLAIDSICRKYDLYPED